MPVASRSRGATGHRGSETSAPVFPAPMDRALRAHSRCGLRRERCAESQEAPTPPPATGEPLLRILLHADLLFNLPLRWTFGAQEHLSSEPFPAEGTRRRMLGAHGVQGSGHSRSREARGTPGASAGSRLLGHPASPSCGVRSGAEMACLVCTLLPVTHPNYAFRTSIP